MALQDREWCYACLLSNQTSKMYGLSAPETLKLFKECTNLSIVDDSKYLCIMCYKQCEIWYCFRNRCQESQQVIQQEPIAPEENTIQEEPIAEEKNTQGSDQAFHNFEMDSEYFEDILDLPASTSTAEVRDSPIIPKQRPVLETKHPEWIDEIKIEAKQVRELTTISKDSREIYIKEYNRFKRWKNSKGFELTTEDVLLEFFKECSATMAPTTLLSKSTRLKACLAHYEDIHMDEFMAVKFLLKKKQKGYKTKQTTNLTMNDIKSFILDAPDENYLVHKVILILAVIGEMRQIDIYGLKMNNIEDKDSLWLITVVEQHTKITKTIRIANEPGQEFDPVDIIRKYFNLRRKICVVDHFLVQIRDGRPCKQRVGSLIICNVGREVAKFLGYANFKSFTVFNRRRPSRGTGLEQSDAEDDSMADDCPT